MVIKIIVGVLIGVAAYFILADAFQLPTVRTSKSLKDLSKLQREKTGSIDIWLGNLAGAIAKHLPMNEFKRQELEADLRTAQINSSPELFKANALVKSLLVGILAVPAAFIFPVISPVVLILAALLYRQNMRSLRHRIRMKREKIERDLPRLVATVEKKLTYQRSILTILEDFVCGAGPELKQELEITIADMHSGNEEAAVTRLEARVGSPMLSDVCRGFISLIHGDAAPAYWSALAMKFSDLQRQRLRAEADKAPRKVRRLSMCLLACFMLIYVVVIISQISSSMGILFQ